MNAFLRWGKFNLVGAMGMVVQLAALALLNRWLPGHYLYTSTAAIELTLLHNFIWHWHYTWRDRRDSATRLRQLVRFHLSNGVVSVLGNLALMWLLVHEAHLPVLASNVVTILCCSIANFYIGNKWAFAEGATARTVRGVDRRLNKGPSNLRIISVVVLAPCLALSAMAQAQTSLASPTPDGASASSSTSQIDAPVPAAAPNPAPPYHATANDSYLSHVGAFCGIGASTSAAATEPTTGCGAGITLLPLPIFFEVGVMGPQANRSYLSGYISLDGSIPLAPESAKYLPMAIVGYSRLFETGHALDYGLALALPRLGKHRDDSKSLRIELRDYWTFANPPQHNIMIRVGWMAVETD